MNALFIKYAVMAVLAAVSGFFLVGFIIFSISALLAKKKQPQKLWGGLLGIGINGLIFLLTFPAVFPVLLEAINKVLFKFR
ncbi:MAG: hypothetical protein PHW26_03035 [Eubacteriales bacterium]|jgi:hypothetical protein|nr:hypothetical protein [Eubacteriales bacterium]